MKIKKQGFTLVELLAVIIILSLLMAIAVPSSITIGNKIKEKLLRDKLSLAEKGTVLWAQDNKKCFTSSGCSQYPFTLDSNCTVNQNAKICHLTIDILAADEYFKFDEENKVINPLDKEKCLNFYQIDITYNKKNKSFSALLNKTNQNSACP